MSDKLEVRLRAFEYRNPSPSVADAMADLRRTMQSIAAVMDACIPECREKSLAFTALEESAMWAMKGLALTDKGGEVISP